jgi:hypothetical protein
MSQRSGEMLVASFATSGERDTFMVIAAAMPGVLIAVTSPVANGLADYDVRAELAMHLRTGDEPTALIVQGIASVAAAHGATRVVRCGDSIGTHVLA